MPEDAKFTHDCKCCIYCGSTNHDGEHIDLYYCKVGRDDFPALASLIARWGDEGWEYASSHPPEAFAEGFVPEAWEKLVVSRARELGVYLEPKKRK